MFRNRTNSQKPNDALYAAFRESFPHLAASQATTLPASTITTSQDLPAIVPIAAGGLEHSPETAPHSAGPIDHAARDHDLWRLTPSLLDSNSLSFASFANQHLGGYYTPTPGGMNTIYHNQAAGDLHTPNMALQLGTPLSMPMHDGTLQTTGPLDITGFPAQMLPPQSDLGSHLQPPLGPDHHQPYLHPSSAYEPPQQSYAPSMLVHQDSGFAQTESTPEGARSGSLQPRDAKPEPSSVQSIGKSPDPFSLASSTDFRYHVALSAQTAMIRKPNDVPLTYLNKGQAYTLSIRDNQPLTPSPGPVKYRTVIRISFDDDQHRRRPAGCWQLWKEGRGLSESNQRGGKLQAIEFVDPHPGAEDDPRRAKIELESSSFDCFAITWSPPIVMTTAECSIAIRFNFLSTDFSHSKGVKGIPVRLCAKTEQTMHNSGTMPPPTMPVEVCYCKVKLFRDHGAERKNSNDVAHVRKTIEKLQAQIEQAEAGIKDPQKRKRPAPTTGKDSSDRPVKVTKHKRSWSISSHGSSSRPTVEEDLQKKLAAAQEMSSSTRPVSVLHLKGTEDDDPDRFPVHLPPDEATRGPPRRQASWEQRASGDPSESGSDASSPLVGVKSHLDRIHIPRSATSRQVSGDWPISAAMTEAEYAGFSELSSTPVRVRRTGTRDDSSAAWFEALEIDASYVPPAERRLPAIACCYIREQTTQSPHHRAVYLHERTSTAFEQAIARKCGYDAQMIDRTVRINDTGLHILVDDDVVAALPEGQDMTVEFKDLDPASIVKTELMTSPVQTAVGIPAAPAHSPRAKELRLFY